MKRFLPALLFFLLASLARAQTIVPIVGGVASADVSHFNNFVIFVNQNITSVNFSAIQTPIGGAIVYLIFQEDATGGFTIAFSGNIVNACIVSTTANATTVCQFQYNATNSNWYGVNSGGGGGGGGGTVTNSGNLALGLPTFGKGTVGIQTAPERYDVSLQTGSDICAKLIAAFTAASNKTAIIDATALNTSQTCSSASGNPFVNVNSNSESALIVLMPCVSITTDVQWYLNSNDVVIKGCGIGGFSMLQNSATFPANTTLFKLGDNVSKLIDGSRLEDWRLNCANVSTTGCQPFYGSGLNEQSGLKRVNIIGGNAFGTTPCVTLDGTNAQLGHYVFDEVSVNRCGTANDGIFVNGHGATQGTIQRITCSNTGFLTNGGDCVHYLGSLSFDPMSALPHDVHAEGFRATVNFDSYTTGSAKDIDCTGVCTEVLLLSTTFPVNAQSMQSVSSGTHIVNNTNLSHILENTVDPRINIYTQSGSSGSNHELWQNLNGTFLDQLTATGLNAIGTATGTSLTVTGGLTSTSDGVHAGEVSLVGNTTVPSIPSNTFNIIGPNLATFTSYALQFPSTAPTNGQTIVFGTAVGSVVPITYGAGGLSGLTTGFFPKASSSTTVANSLCDEGITTANVLTCTDTSGAAFSGPLSAKSDGVHAGELSAIGNTTTPSIPSNTVNILGPNSASFTAYGLQLPSTGPSAKSLMYIAAPSSNISQVTFSLYTQSPVGLFSSLPACAGGTEGTQAAVSDSTTNTWGATITGSGANHVLAYCDGTNWTVTAK